jgi:hypothetical protein
VHKASKPHNFSDDFLRLPPGLIGLIALLGQDPSGHTPAGWHQHGVAVVTWARFSSSTTTTVPRASPLAPASKHAADGLGGRPGAVLKGFGFFAEQRP